MQHAFHASSTGSAKKTIQLAHSLPPWLEVAWLLSGCGERPCQIPIGGRGEEEEERQLLLSKL